VRGQGGGGLGGGCGEENNNKISDLTGHISLPAAGKTTLNRILNPRIVFTSHINNSGLYACIQSELGGIGRFQLTGTNTLRYIIGDIKGSPAFPP